MEGSPATGVHAGRVRTTGGFFGLALLALAVSALGVAGSARVEAEELYALERGGPACRVIDRLTGADLSTISSTVFGDWRGMAMSPSDGVMSATDAENLFTIDLVTGGVVDLGLFGSVVIRDLTFDRAGTLYGVTGAQGDDPHSLHEIDPINAVATFRFGLNGGGGHGIAYDPAQAGILYHLAWDEDPFDLFFETVDLTTGIATPIPLFGDPLLGAPLGLVYDSIDGVFRLFDSTGAFYSLTRDGVVAALGTNAAVYFGLAFDQETTRGALFADGFESGDTSAWSTTVP